MKKFEFKNKDDKRRLLLNKKMLEGDTAVQTNGLGVMTKLGALTRKQLRAFIAVIVALAVVVPTIVFLGLRGKADSNTSYATKENPYVFTKKEASDNKDGTYHIYIEGYATALSIVDPTTTDTMLVLERSTEMGNELYFRPGKKNLQTYTDFIKINENLGHHMLYDPYNPENEVDSSTIGSGGLLSTYADDKYVKDPNVEGMYVYLCQTDKQETGSLFGIPYHINNYTYTIMDSHGNVYESTDSFRQLLIATGATEVINRIANVLGIKTNLGVSEINFEWKFNVNDPQSTNRPDNAKPSYKVTDIYKKKNGITNGTNNSLYGIYHQEGKSPFWIKNDNGDWCQVTMEPIIDRTEGNRLIGYKYTAVDSSNPENVKTYTAYYGNPLYGALPAVFQGFKTYDSNNQLVSSESLLHKSLYSSEDEEVSKLTALKESVEDFLLEVYQNSVDSNLAANRQRVGIVSYASKSSSDDSEESREEYQLTDIKSEETVYQMITSVYYMVANGRRRIDEGLRLAKLELNEHSNANNNVNVISFTAGNPSSANENNNKFEMMIADNALAERYLIENTYNKAKFYSVGLYEGANSDELYGKAFYRSARHTAQVCNGKVGDIWGGTVIAGWTNSEMTPADAAATNRFLNLLSSNYKGYLDGTTYYEWYEKLGYNALITGFNKRGHNTGMHGSNWYFPSSGLSTGGYGYQVRREITADDWFNAGYYYAATTGTELKNAFDSLAEVLTVPTTDLEGSKLTDDISEYFDLVQNDPEHPIKAYTVPGTIENWSDVESDKNYITDQDKLIVTDSGITVKGFNYTDNYVTDTHPGRKLVLEFDVSPIEGFLGGNNVPTNLGSSGIFDRNLTLVESFEVPTVDVTPVPALQVNDQYIYYSNVQDLAELFTIPDETANAVPRVDGLRNDYVNLQYTVLRPGVDGENPTEIFTYTVAAGDLASDGSFNIGGVDKINQYEPLLKENTDYIVRCTAIPKYDGTKEAVSTEDDDTIATVYVFKPTLTVKDDRKLSADADAQGHYYVDLPADDLVPVENTDKMVTWSAEDTDHAPPESGEPELEFEFYEYDDSGNLVRTVLTDETHHLQDKTTNYRVNIIIKELADEDEFKYTTDLDFYVLNDGHNTLVQVEDYDELIHGPRVQETYTYYDEDGEEHPNTPLVDDDNNPVWVIVTEDRELTIESHDISDMDEEEGGFATYINQSDDDKTNSNTEGNFTVFIGKSFKLALQKIFYGNYIVPEDVTFTISDGVSTQTATIDAEDFVRLRGQVDKTTTNQDIVINSGVNYTIAETVDGDYETKYWTIIGDNTSAEAVATDTDTGAEFVLNVTDTNNVETITVVVKNTDLTPDPTATGVSEDTHSTRILLIALAASATVSAGGYGVYRVYRPRKEEN